MSYLNEATRMSARPTVDFQTFLSIEHSRAVAIQKTRRLPALAQLQLNVLLLLAAAAATAILVGMGAVLAAPLLIRRLALSLSV
jgi:hypothetical protein